MKVLGLRRNTVATDAEAALLVRGCNYGGRASGHGCEGHMNKQWSSLCPVHKSNLTSQARCALAFTAAVLQWSQVAANGPSCCMILT